MSGCDTRVDGEKINTTIFQSPFPIMADGKIDTWQFLNASKGVVTLIESFGKVFTPVTIDMNGNIVKLTNKYNIDTSNYKYIDDMILSEKGTDEVIATDALLWLCRGLHFVQRFFEFVLEDTGNTSDELVSALKSAYTETLRPYHGWFAQQIFGIIVRMCPTRSQLIRNIRCENSSDEEETVLTKMSEFTSILRQNVVFIKEFYVEHDLESRIKM